MTSLTQKIRRFTGGISSQPDEFKKVGQVRDALNCTPDVTYGLLKRPGTNYLANLGENSGGKWFFINKRNPATGSEKYVGQINNETGKVRIWDLRNGKEMRVCYADVTDFTDDFPGFRTIPSQYEVYDCSDTAVETYFSQGSPAIDDLQVLTVNDVTYITNRKVPVTMSANCGEKQTPEGFFELRTLAPSTEYNLRFFDITTTQKFVTRVGIVEIQGDIDCPSYPNTIDFTDDDGLELSIVVNRYEAPDGVEYFDQSVCLTEAGTGNAYNVGQRFNVEGCGATFIVEVLETEEFNERSEDPIIDATFTTPASGVTSDSILDSLVNQIDGNEGFTAEKIGSGIYFTRETAFSVETTNGSLSRLLGPTQYDIGDVTHYVATATNVTELPTQCKNGLVVLVSNTQVDEDDYYVQFYGDNNVDGAGVWEETYQPGIPTTFNPQSMPHAIVRLPDADPDDPDMLTFLVTGFRWIPREVGDETTNPRPSFAPKEGATFGRPINNMIFYRNRLAFMVDENIVLSKAGEYFDFWVKTALTVSPDDPIDLQTTSNYPSVLYNGIVNNTGLILFSQNNQWLVSTENDRLSPDTVKISLLSSYNFNPDSNPVSLGTTVGFVGDQGKYTRFYEMAAVQREGEPDVVEQSKVIERLLPPTLNYVSVSKENDMVALAKKGEKEIWLFRYFDTGERRQQSSWFRWEFNGTVVAHEVIFDSYYLVLEKNGQVYLVRCDLRSLANPLTFEFDTDTQKNIPADSYRIYLEYIQLKSGNYTNGKTYFDLDDFPVFSGEKIVAVSTEVNAALTREDAIQGRYSYAKIQDDQLVLRGDWTGSPVAFGYDFNMKVVLPTFFVSKQSDNTSTSFDTGNLIVHRLKVSLGQTGYYTTTLKRLGRPDYTQTYEAKPMDFYDADELGWMPYYEQTTPIYQRNKTFNLIIESQNPSPAVVQSATLEGVYTENYYRRI